MRRYTIAIGGKEYLIDVRETLTDQFRVMVEGQTFNVQVVSSEEIPSPFYRRDRESQFTLTSPMPGIILSVEVSPGDTIQRGQTLVILEAMKMKNALQAPHDGVVKEILVQPGKRVDTGESLIRFAGNN